MPHSIRTGRCSRRSLLAGLGAAGAVAPFVPLLDSHATSNGFPTRLLTLFSGGGTYYPQWAPQGSEHDFTLSPILEPLTPYQDHLVILGHVRIQGSGSPGDGHQKGTGMLWTGSSLVDVGDDVLWGGGISVDQHIAQTIGTDTRFPSLECAIQPNVGGSAAVGGPSVWSRTIYAGSAQPIVPEVDPIALFDRVFSDVGSGDGQLDEIRARRRSVLDAVHHQLDAVAARYGTEDQHKLQAHLDSIRALELRNEAAVADCSIPSVGNAIDPDANENFPALSRMFIDQIVQAFACDLTRVASLQWARSVANTRFEWLGHDQGHHEISHLDLNKGYNRDKVIEINRWFATELAYLIEQLAAIPEGDGTMLDNTLIVWGNELGNGPSHKTRDVPFVLAGGAGGRLTTGRWLDFPDELRHHRLLVSICHALGLEDQATFGDADSGSGGVPGLT